MTGEGSADGCPPRAGARLPWRARTRDMVTSAGVVGRVVVAVCKSCGEEVDELFSVKVEGRTRRLCEDCADKANEQQEIQEESEAAVQQMMGFRGRRGS